MGVVDLLFPKQCLNCKRKGRYVCSECIVRTPKPRQICPVCERPSVDGMTHAKCRRPLSLDGLTSVFSYNGIVRKAILGFKYKFALEVAKELADYMQGYLLKETLYLPKDPVLIPVPLFWLRSNWRGFNQAEVIGKIVAEKMGWKYQPGLLIRKKLKRPQTELKKDERSENVRGVFALNPSYKLQATSYVLFDDVYTTGSTLKEAAKVLKRNRARQVWGLTIAR